MVLPLLMSLGLPALAASGSVPFLATLGASVGTAGLAGLGAGLGSFIQTGDLGDGIKTGLTSFIGGKLLGGLTGSGGAADTKMMQTAIPGAAGNLPRPGFLQAAPTASGAAATQGGMFGNLFSTPGMQQAAAGAMAPGVLPAAFIGQTMSDMSQAEKSARDAQRRRDEEATAGRPPMPRPMRVTANQNPYASGGGEGLYFQYQRPPAPEGYTPEYPYYYAGGGILGLRRMQEGGEMEVDDRMQESGMNEKDIIVQAISAIRGESAQPEIVLGMFVQKYGEDALRDLVDRVQSGEFDDTVERFAEGDKGMVRGPGDGSGVDDMVPATLEGEQDVLLSDGEFVLRKKTADALEKAYGGGFLDMVNRSEDDAPRKLEAMVG
jgi:hypothetical protein